MIRFGEFIFDNLNGRILTFDGHQELVIEPKLIKLLSFLLERPNTIISRDELHQHLWEDSIVTDNAINKLVGNLRKTLGDDAKNPRYIQTIPKRGYRLVSEVTLYNIVTENQTGQSSNVIAIEDSRESDNSAKKSLYQAAGVILSLIVIGFLLRQPVDVPNKLETEYSVPLTRSKGVEFSPRMHPDKQHLYYLIEMNDKSDADLWLKNLNTDSVKQINLDGNISKIITVIEDEVTRLIYLSKSQSKCGVHQALLTNPLESEQQVRDSVKLFDCSGKRIKDLDYHQQQNAIYYTAQPENLWPNQIFAFDIATKQTFTVTQPEPNGWGHHHIDISPNGEKLLVMSTTNDHNTQLYSLNLSNNEILEGIKFERPVQEAIWSHDSTRIIYFSAPPSNQIISTDFYGENARTLINVSEELSSQLSRLDDGHLLFSTNQKNYDIRWVTDEKHAPNVNNSIVFDVSPIAFHRSDRYLFESKRSGQAQIYLGNYHSEEVKALTKFKAHYSLGYMAISSNDTRLLISINNKVYYLYVDELTGTQPLADFDTSHLIYTSEAPIIALDWFGGNNVAITVASNGIPRVIALNALGEEVGLPNGNWSYGLMDSEAPTNLYVIEQKSNALRLVKTNANSRELEVMTDTLFNLPDQFYHAKIDQNTLYYVTTTNDTEFLHQVSLANVENRIRFPLNRFSSYDVAKGKIIVSDMAGRDGDIYRTID